MFDQPVSRGYVWGTLGWVAGFALSSKLIAGYTESLDAGSPARIALALVPLVFLVPVFRLDLGFYRKLDEMQRLIMLECMTIGYYATFVTCAAGLMLEAFGGLPRMSPLWVLTVPALASLLGWLVLRRKYR